MSDNVDNSIEHSNAEAFDEAELADALGTLTAQPDEFREGVDAKIESATAERTDTAQQPTWMRRAASIAPPGLADLAMVGPGSGSKSLLGWLVTPWALLALGFFGMLAATFRLEATGSDENTPLKQQMPGAKAWSCVGLAPVALAVMAMFDTDPAWLTLAFLLGGLIVVIAVRSLSRAGLADRERIGVQALGGLFVLIILAMLAVMGHRDATSWLTLLMLPVIGLTALVIGKLANNYSFGKFLLGFAALYVWMSWDRLNLEPMNRAELVQWCEDFDHEAKSSTGWELLGYARLALGEAAPDYSHAARQLESFAPRDERAHWRIGYGAWRAGLLTDALAAEFPLSDEFWQRVQGDYIQLYENDAACIAAAVRLQKLSDEQRQLVVHAIDATMARAKEENSARWALVSVETAQALGDETFAVRHRDTIHDILRVAQTPSGRYRGSIAKVVRGEHYMTYDRTEHGIVLMSKVGVPDGFDVYELDRFLTRSMSRLSDRRGIQLAMMREHLRSFADVQSKDAALFVFLRENLTVLVVFLFCGLSLWVVVRAPKPVPIEVGPIAATT